MSKSSVQESQFGDQLIRFDRQKTTAAYSTILLGGAERCGCSYCANFVAQRSSVFPATFHSVLELLGIDFTKDGEVYEAGKDDDLRIYGGWFYFAGEVIQSGERTVAEPSGFAYWFVNANRLPKPGDDFGERVAAVEFLTKLPWLLADPPS